MKEYIYDEATDTLGVRTHYDPEETIVSNAEQRATGRVMVGSKGQQMLHAASIPVEHVEALRNLGYNLLSADPDEVRRALLYIQTHEPVWLTVEGKPFASFRQRWH